MVGAIAEVSADRVVVRAGNMDLEEVSPTGDR